MTDAYKPIRQLLSENYSEHFNTGKLFFHAWFIYFLEVTVFEGIKARPGDKRKREKLGDPSEIESYKGKTIFSDIGKHRLLLLHLIQS